MNVEVLSILAGILELLGIYLLGKKIKWGFISNIIAGILWISFSIITHSAFGLIIVCSTGFILNSKGYLHWRKDEQD